MSKRLHKLVLALLSLCFAVWYGEITVEHFQGIRAGRDVAWIESFGVVLSGRSFLTLSAAFTILAVTAAFATWSRWRSAWVLTAMLWGSFLVPAGIHLLTGGSDLRQTIYFFAALYAGTMLTFGVRRMVRGWEDGSGSQKAKSVVPDA